MRRVLSLAVFGVVFVTAPAAIAQTAPQPRPVGRPEGGEEARRLEAELTRLRDQVRELEARLDRLRDARQPERRPGEPKAGGRPRGPGFGPMGGGRGFGGPGFGGPARGFGPMGGGRGFGGPPMPGGFGSRGPGGSPDVARRLDRIIDELEQLRNELSRPQPKR